jgi:hypothetical protein
MLRSRTGASTVFIVGTIVAVVVITTGIVFVVITASHSGGGAPVEAQTTIYLSATCTSYSATTNGLSTTTYVRSYPGNLTVITRTTQFSSNVTAICR